MCLQEMRVQGRILRLRVGLQRPALSLLAVKGKEFHRRLMRNHLRRQEGRIEVGIGRARKGRELFGQIIIELRSECRRLRLCCRFKLGLTFR